MTKDGRLWRYASMAQKSNPPGDWLAAIFAESHVAIGISRLDDGRFVAVNDAFLDLFGYGRAQVIGRTSAELGLWPLPEERTQLIEAIRGGKAVSAFEARFRKRSGETGDLQISASIFTFDATEYLVGLLTNISERKDLLRRLRANEARLETALKASELVVFHQDRQLRYTWIANPALGVGMTELIGRTDAEAIGRQAARPLIAIKRRVLRSGHGEREELWVTNNGRTGCFDLIVEPERDADGKITGIVCAATDITLRKRAEEYLSLQAQILENLEEGVNLVDAQGILRYTNPRFDAMFGYAEGELVGRPAAILNAPDQQSPEETARTILDALERHARWSGDIRNRRKDGSLFLSHANVVAATHPKFGRIWVSVQSDVTALRQTQEELEASYRAIGRFADHAQDEMEELRRELAREVHDQIGATLTGIRMQIEALADGPCGSELRRIRGEIDHAMATARTLCTQLRPPMLDDLGLAETLRWYARDWARRTGIRVSTRIAELVPEPVDPLRIDLFRMLQELLTNIARHAGARRVGVSLTRSRQVLRLNVSDDGQGFAPSHGNGFGLLGIRERLRRHGGRISIESTPRGSRVTLTFPGSAP